MINVRRPTYIFLCVSGVLGRGEFSFSINLGTDEVVDMLSQVSSVSPAVDWLSNVDMEALFFSFRFSFFFFFSFFF